MYSIVLRVASKALTMGYRTIDHALYILPNLKGVNNKRAH